MKTVFIPCHSVCSVVNGRLPENSPAQRDSGISKLGMGLMGLMGVIGVMGLMGEKPEKQNRSTQRDSKISILKNRPLCPYCPYCPLVFKTRPAQRGYRISILGVMGILRSLEILGWKTKNENSPAQPDSGNSILEMMEHYHRRGCRAHRGGIFTMLIKNKVAVLKVNGGMSQ